MSRKTILTISLIAVLLVGVAGLIAATLYVSRLPERLSQHETILLGQNRLVPGSQAALRLLVRDSKDGSPLEGAQINVALKPQAGGEPLTLFSGTTNASGTAEVSFSVPDGLDPAQTLVIETRSRLGSDSIERAVTVARDYRVLLSTDKPIYQPGQVIHLRALALSAFDLIPAAGQDVEITIADGKGNKVFRQTVTTSDFGAAWTDFQLAGEVNTGAYKITALMGNTSSEKTVTVEHYVLPKFNVDLQTERSFYLPGQRVNGSLQADYFFGKPVENAAITIEGYTFDVQRNVVFSLQGETDASGNFTFEFDLPGYLAGSEFEGGMGRFYLQATVTDQAQHSETSNLSLPVSASALVIEAVPEGGVPRQGVENILYILTSYPDGTPSAAQLSLTFGDTGQQVSVSTDEYGLAEVRYTPQAPWLQFGIDARDTQGNAAHQDFVFEGQWSEETVLLRPERPVYRVGDAMKLAIFTTQPQGTAYLDIVRDGQTVSTRSVEVSGGKAELVVDLTPDLYGTLELHAYKVLPSGSIARDTRLVVVDRAADLSLDISAGQDTYRPGDTAALNIAVSGQDGQGTLAALGLAIVDESVFALAEQDPGFAKLYFMLESEILTPRYDLHGFSVPDLITGLPEGDTPLQNAVNDAARASLAAAAGKIGSGFSLTANSHQDALNRAYQLRSKYAGWMRNGSFYTFLLLSLGILLSVALPLGRARLLGRSLLAALGVLSFLVVVFLLVPLGPNYAWATSPGDRLSVLVEWLSYRAEFALGLLALFSLVGYLALAGVAIARKEPGLGWTLGLLPAFGVALVVLFYFSSTAGGDINDRAIIAGFVAFLLAPFALWVRVTGFLYQRRALPALAALPLAFFMLVGLLPALSLGAKSAALPAMANGRDFADGVQFGMVVEEAMPMAAPVPTQIAMAQDVAKGAEGEASASTSAAEPPRLRQYFPETMLWLPDAVTGEDGRLALEVPVADSITTWRITALASSRDGRLGSVDAPLRVFQDFFIDLDLPLSLTVGDEVAVPVGIFNYLTEPQTVRLELERSGWFELLDEPVKEVEIGANDISVVYFRVRALQFGMQPFKVTALGSRLSDAILKQVRVYPDGKQMRSTSSDRLQPGEPVKQPVFIPAEAIPGTQSLTVKIYPGVLSQVVEGLDSILRMPFGCFEQTSSTTYPNVLVLDYLKTTNQAAPEVQLKAEEYINLGYQRLTTFEVQSSGGFSLFGDAPADRMLTAYGLQEFADMSRVHPVDPALIERAANWLMSQQSADGSWENDRGLVHENTWSSLGNDRLPVTAYIVWSLVDAGFGDEAATQKGLDYLRENFRDAEDAYVVALLANALVAGDLAEGAQLSSTTNAVLETLAGLAQRDGQKAFWQSGVATFMGSEGQTGSIETTALAAYALLRAGVNPDLANAALAYLVGQKDSFGTWYSTQATVLSLKALIQSVRAGGERADAAVTLRLNGSQERTLRVTPENFDVVQQVTFDDVNLGGDNSVEIEVAGEGNLMYQVTGSYYLPWDKLSLYPELVPQQDLVTIDVAYDRAELAVNDTVNVNVTVSLNEPGGKAESALIDLGLPPGFAVQAEDLAALVARYNDTPPDYAFARIERYELTGRQILIYLSNLSNGKPIEFSFRLTARFPLRVQTPASTAYDYYNPDVQGQRAPQTLVVNP